MSGRVASALLAGVLSACSPGGASAEVLVSAAASLTDVFAEIEDAFETANPAVDVILNVAGSATLREQITAGAPADVFASADLRNITVLSEDGAIKSGITVFATNQLEIAVPPGNPAGVSGLADFERTDLLVGLCAPGVPCGDFARSALQLAGVTPAPDTNEPNVRALLTKIAAGELDAGIVYTTDVVAAANGVDGVMIPASHNVTAQYPVATLIDSPNPEGAAAFVAFVLSPSGRSILAEHGFGVP
ncbi:MAG: molybdate ABC transporter substrate-binding protein [Acidimicrobiia bacterium]|nr:molybdate ABC transporter substrate-binding protein [Acidimicrobiia bacterium]